MELDGINDCLSNFRALVKQQAEAQSAAQTDLSEEDRRSLASAMVQAVDPHRLQSTVAKALLENCDAASFGGVLEQLRGPLPQKMRELEANSSKPEAASELQQYLASLKDHPPAPERIQILREFVAATKAADFFTDMLVAVSRSMALGFTGKEPTAGELNDVRSKASASAENQMLAVTLFTYRTATDDELRQYVSMYETQPFQAFSDATTKALLTGFSDETRHIAEEVKKVADQKVGKKKAG